MERDFPFRTSMDTKSCEFQCKLVNCRCLVTINYVVTNSFLSKIGIVLFPSCFVCGEMSESLEHFFISGHYSKHFWAEVIKWLDNQEVKVGFYLN